MPEVAVPLTRDLDRNAQLADRAGDIDVLVATDVKFGSELNPLTAVAQQTDLLLAALLFIARLLLLE